MPKLVRITSFFQTVLELASRILLTSVYNLSTLHSITSTAHSRLHQLHTQQCQLHTLCMKTCYFRSLSYMLCFFDSPAGDELEPCARDEGLCLPAAVGNCKSGHLHPRAGQLRSGNRRSSQVQEALSGIMSFVQVRVKGDLCFPGTERRRHMLLWNARSRIRIRCSESKHKVRRLKCLSL